MGIPSKYLKLIPHEGIMLCNSKRATIVDNDIFHMLFCELLYSLGGDLGQEVFYRFGYTEGYSDAIHVQEAEKQSEQWFDICLELMRHRGLGEISVTQQRINIEKDLFYVELSIKNAFESEQLDCEQILLVMMLYPFYKDILQVIPRYI